LLGEFFINFQTNFSPMRKIVVSLLAAMFVLSCEEEKAEVPKAPAGTMIVKVNGVSLTPSVGLTDHAEIQGDALVVQGWFVTPGTSSEDTSLYIWLSKAGVGRVELKGNGTWPSDPPGSVTYSTQNKELYQSWKVNEAIVGNVTITKLDKTNKLASGTFEIKLKDANSSEVTGLTEGSFTDLRLY
jgi:hypothetical protein